MPTEKEIGVSGEKAQEIVDVLNSTNFKILRFERNGPISVTKIANTLELSEAYISEQIRAL